MKRIVVVLSLASLLASGCDGGSGSEDAGEPVDSATPPPTDGGVVDSGRAPTDAGPPDDGGVPTIRCLGFDGPNLIVTRDDALHGSSSAVVRVPLELDGAATGLAVLAIDEVIDGTPVRSWDAGGVRAPDGFDGSVSPTMGDPRPSVLFTAVTDADARELAECDLAPWERHAGSLEVRLRTDQTGELTLSCGLGPDFGGRGPEAVRLACARGVPGWLGSDPGISDVTTPVVFRFMDSPTLAHNSGRSAVDAFVASEATLRSTVGAFPGEMECAGPSEWTTSGGTHQLWRGRTSDETWSGPVAPGDEERANWMWQEPGSLPSGFCFPPSTGLPEDECIRPVMYVALRGSSSAGAWEWESDVFDCLDLEP